jgi:hypothetical protein
MTRNNFKTSHVLVQLSENGTTELRMCKYNHESVFSDIWDRKKCLLYLGQYSNLHITLHPPPPTGRPHTRSKLPNVTVVHQTIQAYWQVHILYRQKQTLKCTTTELKLEKILSPCILYITTQLLQVSVKWCCLYSIRSQQISKHAMHRNPL